MTMVWLPMALSVVTVRMGKRIGAAVVGEASAFSFRVGCIQSLVTKSEGPGHPGFQLLAAGDGAFASAKLAGAKARR